jgi:hypothetical protein
MKKIDVSDLDVDIAKFIIPRIRKFRKTTISHPSNMSLKKWKRILKSIEKAFKLSIDENISYKDVKKVDKKVNKGLKLFQKYYTQLWV